MKNLSEVMINLGSYMVSISAVKEVVQIIALIFSIIGTILIAYSRFKEWYDKAKADGKIDKEEINEAVKIAEDVAKEIKEKTDKIEGEE